MSGWFRVALGVYAGGMEIVVWTVLVPMTLCRIAARRTTVRELRQRLRGSVPTAPCILVHGISAGEMAAADPLVRRIGLSGRRVLLSTGTRAGMVMARRLAEAHPSVVGCVWVPWDRRAVRGWLQSFAPLAVVVMETEIWPNLFAACGALGIPLFIANGRVRKRDVRRYRMARGFFRPVLASARWIGAQSARDRDAFVSMGAGPSTVEIAGNLKFDVRGSAPQLPPGLGCDLVDGCLLVAGSTHAPEEEWLLGCLLRLRREGRRMRMVLAPRDARRAARIRNIAQRRSFAVSTWSTLQRSGAAADRSWDVLILDEYGWLASFYEHADIVFVGGTLAPVGGHNVIEPARLGRPVIVGPYLDDIESIVERLEAAGAIIRVSARDPAAALADACRALLDDPDRARAIGSAARAVCVRHAGAADSCWRAISEQMA